MVFKLLSDIKYEKFRAVKIGIISFQITKFWPIFGIVQLITMNYTFLISFLNIDMNCKNYRPILKRIQNT